MLKILDLFSGIGGISLGLERTEKFKTIAFCEVDDYCNKVLRKWWPEVPNFTHGIVGLNSLLRKVRTASQQAFPVRTYPLLVKAPDLPAVVRDSSGNCYEPFAWYDRASHSWRTWQRCLIEEWAPYSAAWPRSGMTRNGIAFRRAPLVPLTKETVSGSSLPTPTARMGGSNQSDSPGAAVRPSLEMMARHNLWPTPTARDWKDGTAQSCANVPVNGLLVRAVHWATPRAQSSRGSGPSRVGHKADLQTQAGGALNPTWVEWLMGYPLGWTELKD